MRFTTEKLKKHLQDVKATIHREVREIPQFKYVEGDFDELREREGRFHLPGYDDSAWEDYRLGSYWGGYDKTAWFRATVPIPREWSGRKLVMRFLVGPRDGGGSTAETLLYAEGQALQAIDIWHEEAWLPPELAGREEIRIALKAWSGVLRVPERRRFMLAQLIAVDEAAEQLYHLAATLLEALAEMDGNDVRRARLLDAMNRAFSRIDFIRYKSVAYYESLREAHGELAGAVARMSESAEMKPKVIGVGHSHIDMAWLWRLAHSREKASRTFSTVLHLMRQYPEYRFLHTSPQLYQFLKRDYPDIYRRVKERVDSGEWEITGGMWIEPDTNLPNGESLVRQILFGKRFIKREFGRETNVVFLPDVFGYNGALPQIIRRSGIKHFITSKISWNQYNRFPHDTFMWRGIDGTDVLTHFITTPEAGSRAYTYNGVVNPGEVKGTWEQYKQKDVNDELIMAFGWGDGGGGPTMEMLEAAKVLKSLPGLPRFELGKLEPFLERMDGRVDPSALPVWDGELYLEYHRGTYTSQGFIKKANRRAETLYHNAEWLCRLADLWLGAPDYPQAELNEGWEKILLNQFHDILPGSSIRQVYEDARADYAEIERIGRRAAERAIARLLPRIRTEADGFAVFNPLSWKRSGLAEVPWREAYAGLALSGSGGAQEIESGGVRKLLLRTVDVPALGYRAQALAPAGPEEGARNGGMRITAQELENAYYRIELDEAGRIRTLYDKRSRRHVLAAGQAGNVLQAFEDRPMNFDAWDIDIYYGEKVAEVNDLLEAAVEETGPLRGVVRLKWRFNRSTVTQRLTVYRDSPRIDFRTEVDWQEKQVLLKAAFPVEVRATRATYDIQFGSIERPTHWNTSWDHARFEVCAHKWADLSEGDYGVAILNDCKYGHDVKDNVMRLTLIKSPIEPDETADRGPHAFTYSLLPHQGDWRTGRVAEEAYELNYPLIAAEAPAGAEGDLPACAGLAEPDCGHVMIETVKKAEDDEATVIRLYEYKQCRSQEARLLFGKPVRKAVECSLVEEEERDLPVRDGALRFPIRPFEVKTLKVWFDDTESGDFVE